MQGQSLALPSSRVSLNSPAPHGASRRSRETWAATARRSAGMRSAGAWCGPGSVRVLPPLRHRLRRRGYW